jgi:hypothetical protein
MKWIYASWLGLVVVWATIGCSMAGADAVPVVVLDATAVTRTNLGWGDQSITSGQVSTDLRVENSLEPALPYFAEFQFPLARPGRYVLWVYVLACNEPWVSAFTWRVDNGSPNHAVPQDGSMKGCPCWVKLGTVNLAGADHMLRFEVTARRRHPDNAYIFCLWKVVLAPAGEKFVPWEENVNFGYNPQVNQGAATGGSSGQGMLAGQVLRFSGRLADPVLLQINLRETVPPVNPVWRDYSEGGGVSSENFFIPYLVKPLRPRFIRKDHCLDHAGAVLRDGPALKFDFHGLVTTINAIRAVGAEPIVGLDAFPWGAVATRPDGRSIPLDEWPRHRAIKQEWDQTVRAALAEIKKRQLPVTYFHCFNEPEYSGFRGQPEAALMVFDVASKAVREMMPQAKMIGIGCGDGVSDIWSAFMDYLQKNPGSADFFDFHRYQCTPEEYGAAIRRLRSDLDRRGLGKIGISMTEWGIASSGQYYHRNTVRTATYNASSIKAMSEAGLEIGCLFSLRDFPQSNSLKFGLITSDGFLKPAYWGQWLWAQLPEQNPRLAVLGQDAQVQSVAYRDGDGVAVLVWYDAPENSPTRQVTISLPGEQWRGCDRREWLLDSVHHLGFIPEGQPVELPEARQAGLFPHPAPPSFSFGLTPASMRLFKLQPCAVLPEVPKSLRNTPALYGDIRP